MDHSVKDVIASIIILVSLSFKLEVLYKGNSHKSFNIIKISSLGTTASWLKRSMNIKSNWGVCMSHQSLIMLGNNSYSRTTLKHARKQGWICLSWVLYEQSTRQRTLQQNLLSYKFQHNLLEQEISFISCSWYDNNLTLDSHLLPSGLTPFTGQVWCHMLQTRRSDAKSLLESKVSSFSNQTQKSMI